MMSVRMSYVRDKHGTLKLMQYTEIVRMDIIVCKGGQLMPVPFRQILTEEISWTLPNLNTKDVR